MSTYESHAEPIKLGYLYDFKLPPDFPPERSADTLDTMKLVFKQGYEQGLIDRPVQIILKEVEGFPKGTIKNVTDAYHQLVDEGCIAVFGPFIADNAVPVREVIEQRQVPSMSVTGSEDFLGEWTFSLNMGSMLDEPVVIAHLLRRRGLKTVGAIIEQSLVGETYIRNFRRVCRQTGLNIVAEEFVAQTANQARERAAVRKLHDRQPDALVHWGFGFGVIHVNAELKQLNWDPPRFTGTAWQNAWINSVLWQAFLGWIGLDQYDEGNLVGQKYLDDYCAEYGRRPEYCLLPVNRDAATLFLHAFADAHPLTPRGVKEALERVKLLPAASGAPGTRIGFGKWIRRGWVGAGYLVARKLDPDGKNSHLVERFGQD
jgi:ABC-type branched-subunit amino acid transport system substrate-binding protein